MLNKISIGRYYPLNSLIHTMNSTIKIICLFICVIMLLIPHNILFDIIILSGLFAIMYISKIPYITYLKSILILKWFYISILLINLICGVDIISSLQMIFEICILIIYSQILVLTTTLEDMMSGIENLLLPLRIFRIKTKQLTFCLSLSISFIPLILEQADKIMKSLSSRGINYKGVSLRKKISVIKATIFPLFISTLRKADHLAEALEVRGYNIENSYYNSNSTKIGLFDYVMLLLHIVLFITLILGVIL